MSTSAEQDFRADRGEEVANLCGFLQDMLRPSLLLFELLARRG
jgi:hypothetical protein